MASAKYKEKKLTPSRLLHKLIGSAIIGAVIHIIALAITVYWNMKLGGTRVFIAEAFDVLYGLIAGEIFGRVLKNKIRENVCYIKSTSNWLLIVSIIIFAVFVGFSFLDDPELKIYFYTYGALPLTLLYPVMVLKTIGRLEKCHAG